MTTHAILEQAAANGDMTRAGIVAAANEVTVDYNGLAPTRHRRLQQVHRGESYIYDLWLEDFDVDTDG